MCVVARQDLCCGKTRSLLWLDKTSVVARHKGSTKGGGRRPPPFVEAAEGRLPYVLPQQRSCLATAEILSCHSRDLVLPQHTSGPATTGILPCHILRHPGNFFSTRLPSNSEASRYFFHTIGCFFKKIPYSQESALFIKKVIFLSTKCTISPKAPLRLP